MLLRTAGMGVGFFTKRFGTILVAVGVVFAPCVAPVGVAVGVAVVAPLAFVGVAVADPLADDVECVAVAVALTVGVAVADGPAARTREAVARTVNPPPETNPATNIPDTAQRNLVFIKNASPLSVFGTSNEGARPAPAWLIGVVCSGLLSASRSGHHRGPVNSRAGLLPALAAVPIRGPGPPWPWLL